MRYRTRASCCAAGDSPGRSDGTAREEGKQAEDRVVPQEAGAADRGEDEGRLHRMRAGRGDMRGRRTAQEGRLHAQGGLRRLHVHGIRTPRPSCSA